MLKDADLGAKVPTCPEWSLRALAVHAEWLITFSEDAFTWTHTHEKVTVAVRGTLADLMLLFHRSLAPTSTRVELLGDADLLDFWLERASFG